MIPSGVGDKNSNGQNCTFFNEGSDYNCNTEDYIKAFNSKIEGSLHCGVKDWRLPTFDELFMLIDIKDCVNIGNDYCVNEIFDETSSDKNTDIIGFWTSSEP